MTAAGAISAPDVGGASGVSGLGASTVNTDVLPVSPPTGMV